MTNKLFLTCAIITLPVLLSQAYANTGNKWYVGVDAGITDTNIDEDNFFTNGACVNPVITCSSDDSDNAARISVGYQVNPHLAIELGYADLGDTAELNPINSATNASGIAKQDTKAFSVVAIGKKKLGNSKVSVLGKAGASYWDSDITFDRTPDLAAFPDQTQSDSDIDPIIGLAVEYAVNHQWHLRAGWDRYFSVGERKQGFDIVNLNLKTVDTDVDMFYVGATVSF